MADWTEGNRIEVVRKISATLLNEALNGVVMTRRVAELSQLILYALTMPSAFLDANRDNYAQWL